ncbi:response regulator [Undibacterium sp. Ren11W]|uniref:response regulator n=1 Tax=Undibacterium sp. Ren11W TaxID=3413045 RepID=UPI003BF29F31
MEHPEEQTTEHEATTNTRASSLRVMVIDDDTLQIDFVSALLHSMGIFDILSAVEGADALEFLDSTEKQPDLLICDLLMPHMDGFEFLAQLSLKKCQIPIVVMSGQTQAVRNSAKSLAQLKSLNYLGQLEKPISLPALQALIDQILTN